MKLQFIDSERSFFPLTKSSKPKKRLLIIADNGNHATNDFMFEWYHNDVNILYLSSHGVNILQLLDLTVFNPVKTAYCPKLNNFSLLNDSTPIGNITFLKAYSKIKIFVSQKNFF